MKIAVLLPDFRGGGAERVSLDLAHYFAKVGYNVEFVVMRAHGELLAEAKANFSVWDLETSRAREVLPSLAKYISDQRPDALLANMFPLTVIAPISKQFSGKKCKIIITEHNTLSAQYASWGRVHRAFMRVSMAIGYRLADCRIAVSSGVLEDIANLSKLKRSFFEVVHNPVKKPTPPCALAIDEVEKFWGPKNGPRILTVGSLKSQKNHFLLMKAFKKICDMNAKLMIVGDGPERSILSQQARDLGISDRVVFPGFQHNPTPFFLAADLFVLSSNYEGFGNVIVEALACGTSVVSTDCPSGPAEILKNGKWGRLTPVGNADALAEAMRASLEDDHDTAALKRRAADFAPEIAARKYLKLLDL